MKDNFVFLKSKVVPTQIIHKSKKTFLLENKKLSEQSSVANNMEQTHLKSG